MSVSNNSKSPKRRILVQNSASGDNCTTSSPMNDTNHHAPCVSWSRLPSFTIDTSHAHTKSTWYMITKSVLRYIAKQSLLAVARITLARTSGSSEKSLTVESMMDASPIVWLPWLFVISTHESKNWIPRCNITGINAAEWQYLMNW